jgi:hypothetical protein
MSSRFLKDLLKSGQLRKGSNDIIKRKINRLNNILKQLELINKPSDRREIYDRIYKKLILSGKKISYTAIERTFNDVTIEQRKRLDKLLLDEDKKNKKDKTLTDKIKSFNKKEIKSFEVDIKKMKIEYLFNKLFDIDGYFIINVGSMYYTADRTKLNHLLTEIKNRLIQPIELFGSDPEFMMKLNEVDNITIMRKDIEDKEKQMKIRQYTLKKYGKPEPEKKQLSKKSRPNGAFFKYYHTLEKIDLSKYGIFTKKIEEIDDEEYIKKINENCLIHAFIVGGMEKHKINQIKSMVINNSIPICKLNDICQKLNISIHLKQDGYVNLKKYGSGEEIYNIGLIEEHYFLIEDIEYTTYSINNYFDIHEVKNFHNIKSFNGKNYIRDTSKYTNSYNLIKILIENKETHLEEIKHSVLTKSIMYNKVIEDFSDLTITDDNFKLVKKSNKSNDMENIFFDFETYTENETLKHIPYLCCYEGKNIKGSFIGENCGFQMLVDIIKKYKNETQIRLIAHNCSYDFTFLIPYLYNINSINDGKNLYSVECHFKYGDKDMKIYFKDSYKLISAPLSKFNKMFFPKEKIIKEIMPYKLYTKENIDKKFIDITEAHKYLNDDEKQQFNKNIKEWNLITGDKYDIIEYSKIYCQIDCQVLKKGYNVFRKWILDLKIDIDDIISSASLADLYFYKQGCYKDCYELNGVVQQFIQGCVVGGRCMTKQNEKYHIKNVLNDLDAISLYPSAMYRIDGFIKGTPKIIENLTMDFLNSVSYYFIDIKILDIEIERDFPLLSYKDTEGIRNFVNNMDGEIIRVDKYGLEDLIKFHKINFEIIRGYYFNDGFNKTINKVIKHVFDKRLELKSNKNPAEQIYKLIMNSAYGKTIMKEHNTESKWFNYKEDADKYIEYNYHSIISYSYIGDKVKVDIITPINEHYNRCHIGSSILSMSKRIMNEVICLAEDNNINIYYQDTDSLHIEDEKVDKLAELFKQKYKRELVGGNLGQFHCDFEMDGYQNIVSVESYFLGKKMYIDKLQGEDEEGKINIDYHIRLKGIPNSCIKYTTKQLNKNVMTLYKDLYDGETIDFDLLEGGSKSKFEYKAGEYYMRENFKRKISVY